MVVAAVALSYRGFDMGTLRTLLFAGATRSRVTDQVLMAHQVTFSASTKQIGFSLRDAGKSVWLLGRHQ